MSGRPQKLEETTKIENKMSAELQNIMKEVALNQRNKIYHKGTFRTLNIVEACIHRTIDNVHAQWNGNVHLIIISIIGKLKYWKLKPSKVVCGAS